MTRHLTARMGADEGSALVTAILVTFIVLTLGLSIAGTADTQQKESRRERERESTFQLSEGVLGSQVFQLSVSWPGATSVGYPASCTEASLNTAGCPTPAALKGAFQGVDYADVEWVTTVRDNRGPDSNPQAYERFYDEALIAMTNQAYDKNRDNKVWVRAQARLRDGANPNRFVKGRVVVALVQTDKVDLNLPRATLVADHFAVTNSGNKTIIDTDGTGNEWSPGDVVLRCDATPTGKPCAQYDNSKARQQVDPPKVILNPSADPTTLSSEKLGLLRSRAISEGNYYATGCAPSLQGDKPGEVVFMEASGGECQYPSNSKGAKTTASHEYNTKDAPGVVVMGSGSLYIGGNATFHGVLYHANVDDSSATLVEIGGGASIYGSIQVAGRGGIYAGSNKVNLVFNPNYIDQIDAFGTASIVQNSFREVTSAATPVP